MRKRVPYEESIRVPMLIRYDPLTGGSEQATSPAFTLNIDLAPTIGDLAGVPTPGVEGTSLLPILRGEATDVRGQFLIEHVASKLSGADPPTYCAVRDRRRLYVWYQTGEEELYILARDPFQLRNRAGAASWNGVRLRMQAELLELCQPPPPGLTLPGG